MGKESEYMPHLAQCCAGDSKNKKNSRTLVLHHSFWARCHKRILLHGQSQV